MKLLFFISSMGSGGAERVMAVLTNALARKGYNVTIGVLTQNPPFYDLEPSIKVEHFQFNKRSGAFGRLKNRLNLLTFIRQLSKKEKPDIIISFIYKLNTEVLLSTRFLDIPVIASEHNTLDTSMTFIEKVQRFQVSKLANIVTILTEHDFKFLGDKIPQKVVMPNPLPFKPIEEYNDDREKRILAVGSVVRYKHKGLDNLVKIWVQIADKYPDWKLQVAGGYDENSLKILKSIELESGISNKIDFLGQVKDIKRLMYHSSIFVLASRWEGFPMVLMEAMSQGCTCVSYDLVSGPNEMIIHGYDGLLIENQNKSEMASGLMDLMDNASKRRSLAMNAIKSIEKFSVDNIVQKWEELFKKVL